MNRDRIEGHSKQMKGRARKHWGEEPGDERPAHAAERERLSGKMQKTHGIRQDEARQQIRELRSRY
jgi:uncharacterized protein YjbJ (UPF0337 family)